MSAEDLREQQLRINWLEKQMQKADFDMQQERRRTRRETFTLFLTALGLMVVAFAAGHFIR